VREISEDVLVRVPSEAAIDGPFLALANVFSLRQHRDGLTG
jgi:hypothetical protein